MKSHWATMAFFKLMGDDWLERQRVAGRVASETLMLLENMVNEKVSLSLIEMNAIAEEYIIANKCSPTFKDYKGHNSSFPFPAGVCISVNQQLVHGIPTDYKLKNGDVVSFDLGATFEGAIADTALTCIYGEPKNLEHVKMIKATDEALMRGIAAVSIGKKIGAIGHAVHRSAKGNGFEVITSYGGHGICESDDGKGVAHAPPFIANKDSPDNGIRIQKGLVLAIEPMLVFGSTKTYVGEDGWTVYGIGISAHFEHTIYVHEDHVEIITKREYNA